MDFQKLVDERRSMRGYAENGAPNAEELKEMIACAQKAPSWKNSQTARFYVVVGEEKLAEVNSKGLPEFNAANAKNAALVVTTFEKTRSGFNREGVADNELGDEWGAYDLGLNNMLFCLKAKEMGYDTLIMGIRDGEALRDILEIPDSQEVVAVIAVGKGNADMPVPKRKETDAIVRVF